MMQILTLLLLSTLSFAGAPLAEDQKIERLLNSIETSNVVFIRNGDEHKAPEATEHLRMKFKKAGNSKWTAKMFIDKIASESSMTHKPYQIKLPDGKKVLAKDWLNEKLKSIEAQGSSTLPNQ